MKITDTSKYDLIKSTATVEYTIKLDKEEVSIPLIIAISKAFPMVEEKDNKIVIGGTYIQGFFQDKAQELRRDIFKGLASLSNEFLELEVNLDFEKIPSIMEMIEAKYQLTKEQIKSGCLADTVDFYIFKSSMDADIAQINLGELNYIFSNTEEDALVREAILNNFSLDSCPVGRTYFTAKDENYLYELIEDIKLLKEKRAAK